MTFNTSQNLKSELNRLIAEISHLREQDWSEDQLILDLPGFDSLSYAQLMLGLEQFSGKPVDESKVNWANIRTIRQILDLFR